MIKHDGHLQIAPAAMFDYWLVFHKHVSTALMMVRGHKKASPGGEAGDEVD